MEIGGPERLFTWFTLKDGPDGRWSPCKAGAVWQSNPIDGFLSTEKKTMEPYPFELPVLLNYAG